MGLIANIESREMKRVNYEARDLAIEQPQASNTDDVEGLFGLLHEMLGDIFSIKQFGYAQPKILNEFVKTIYQDFVP